jgi:uncharacterized protein
VRVSVSDIPEEGLSIDFHGKESAWEGLEGMDMASLPAGRLFLEKRGLDVFLRGQFTVAVRLPCGRCLEGFTFPLDLTFRHTLRPLDRELREVREVELVRDDLEYGCYEGDVVQLDRLIEEHLLLSLPMKALCRDDCLGICPRCGANRNDKDCGCSTRVGRGPFDALKDYFS